MPMGHTEVGFNGTGNIGYHSPTTGSKRRNIVTSIDLPGCCYPMTSCD